MGKYQAYPTYKNAESKWLDQLPMNWKRAPLKHLVAIKITDGPHETPEFLDDGVPFLSAEAVKNNKLDFSKKRGFISRELHEFYSKKCLPKIDDVFMVKSGNTTGNIAIVETTEEFNIWSPLALIRADKHKILPRFIFYVMQADFFRTSVELSWSQGTQPNIGMAVIENLHIPVASLIEQRLIANFLDHETAKIDTLIEKQQQLIQLLKEKRQAVISHAVTKGLNPNAPMKDSGVEWLGEVPEHWVVRRLKQLVTAPLMYGANEAALDTDPDCPRFIRITDVLPDGTLKSDTFRSLNEELAKPYLLSDGDVLLARTGGTVGKSFMYARSWGRCCFAGYLIKASLNQNKIMAEWFYQYTNTQYYWEWIASNQIQATLPNVSADKYNNFVLAVPPLSEQISILGHLKQSVDLLNDLENKALVAIELMQERRTALISAAVTGKIDVRNFSAQLT